VDGEEHGHLAGEGRVPVELDLVAVLDLALVLRDDAADHLARQAAHHRGLTGDDADRVLLLPAQIDLPVTARALTHADGPGAPDAEAFAASTEAHAARAHPARPVLGAALGGAHAESADGLVHPGAGASRAEHVGDRLALERPEQTAAEGAGPAGFP